MLEGSDRGSVEVQPSLRLVAVEGEEGSVVGWVGIEHATALPLVPGDSARHGRHRGEGGMGEGDSARRCVDHELFITHSGVTLH